jgi:hypothetical protein
MTHHAAIRDSASGLDTNWGRMPAILMTGFLTGFGCLLIMLSRPITVGEPLRIQRGLGQWRVRYPDGKMSKPFNRGTAENYQNMFGGEVIPL